MVVWSAFVTCLFPVLAVSPSVSDEDHRADDGITSDVQSRNISWIIVYDKQTKNLELIGMILKP